MSIEEIRQLAGWIRDAGLTGIELKRPGFELLLKRRSPALATAASVLAIPEKTQRPHIKADGLGVFRASHPAERNAYVKAGDTVAAGQLLGLLQVGLLYLPVRSDQAARVREVLVTQGQSVGYGQPLFEMEEQ
ncbi:biotin/lipoyl-binding protein [Pseudomonas sp. R5(2019)]|uniref:biotin/lipoyl-containing protein n=1 Tax=Pseudomonas sp. R5(2019) TaxID=2697566 RepID=UPI001412476C|nr:biotin/lipoyl-binding protein [Pseudomonas sp. R5(2019)]NBA97564.1 biotin/lipoyl-binding protein [Pseudomonas sp. R5(2019)]